MTRQEREDPVIEPLERLERALTELGLTATLQRQMMIPYVQVQMHRTPGEVVFASYGYPDGPRYFWDGLNHSHTLDDPPGAAERIATALNREQRRAIAERG